jgi:GxxExxY protein
VLYEGEVIGEYYADILVENKVIVEIKAARSLVKENEFEEIVFCVNPRKSAS